MNLVFYFFIILIISILLSTLKINIEKFKLINVNLENRKLINKIFIEIYLFGIFKIFKIKLKNNYFKRNNKILKNKKVINILFDKKIKLEKANIKIELGTKNIQSTVASVFIVNNIISIIFAKKIKKFEDNKFFYSVLPLYNSQDILQISLNSIISIKYVHIIYIIYSLLKESRGKNGRTSNRKNYDYSYEQYKRNYWCKYYYR